MFNKTRLFCLVLSAPLLTACTTDQEARINRDMAEQAAVRADAAEKRVEAAEERAKLVEKILQAERQLEETGERIYEDFGGRRQSTSMLRWARNQMILEEDARRGRVNEEQKQRDVGKKSLCRLYSLATRSCANFAAGNYEYCMSIKTGYRYSRLEESDCKER